MEIGDWIFASIFQPPTSNLQICSAERNQFILCPSYTVRGERVVYSYD
jgi:hypothetical protein